MNPYLLLSAVLAVAGAGFVGYEKGDTSGRNAQSVIDQKAIDDVNKKLDLQKIDAAEMLSRKNAELLATMNDRDTLKNKLEKDNADYTKKMLVVNANLASERLYFKSTQNCGSGGSGLRAGDSPSYPASVDGTSNIQLPDQVERNLRQLELDADILAGFYKKCYDWAQKVK